MTECPHCEYNKKRAQHWREEVYRLGGHPLPEPERESEVEKLKRCLFQMQEAAKDLVQQAQPKQEQGQPVACNECNGKGKMETGIGMMVCDVCHGSGVKDSLTTQQPPQQRKPLTDEQISAGYKTLPIKAPMSWSAYHAGARMAEAAHGIKENT